jgi:magnesium transporter
MITAYVRTNGTLTPLTIQLSETLPEDAIWIDLLGPSREEEKLAERALGIALPTREEMREIEISSRLYQENGALFMTATLMTQADTVNPETEPVTFILVGHRLLTIRYANPLPFQVFASQVQRQADSCLSGDSVLAGLLDAIVDRIADVLERVQHDMNQVSRTIFARQKTDFEEALRTIGLAEGLTSRARESLVSITRLLAFLSRPAEGKPNKPFSRSLKTLSRDVLALSDHSSFLANNITFMLNATLGMVNIEQTDIIKIFSVASVVFLPPTLIASIYGMNYQYMPELNWKFGYPLSIVLMVLAAVLPYLYFKRRGWL